LILILVDNNFLSNLSIKYCL